MKKTKKLMALGLVAVMAMAPATVSAYPVSSESASSPATSVTGGATNNDSRVEGVLDEEVFHVEVPKSADNAFDYQIDPQFLLYKTSGAAVSGLAITSGDAILFTNYSSTGAAVTMSGASDWLAVTNKGLSQIDISIDAETVATGGAVITTSAVTTSSAFTSGDGTCIKLQLEVSEGSVTPVALSPESVDAATATATLEVTQKAADSDLYSVSYQGATGFTTGPANKYAMVLTGGATSASFEAVHFRMSGICNTQTDWTGNEKADVSVVWNIDKHSDYKQGAIQIDGTTCYLTSSRTATPFAQGLTIDKVMCIDNGGTPEDITSYCSWAYDYVSIPGFDASHTYTLTYTISGVTYQCKYPENAVTD